MSIGDILSIVLILLLLQIFVPIVRQALLNARRVSAIRSIETKHKSRLITLIHRQESVSLLGIPIARYIDIEDSEALLRAIRLTDDAVPIDLIMHTPGGLVLASEQIACALLRHPAKVTVFVPHYAMSGGTLVAMAADEIVMDPNAVLGPVDPQMGDPQHGYYPAASILAALKQPNPNRDDSTLIMGDLAAKAIQQVHDTVYNLLVQRMGEDKAKEVAQAMSEGRWTHDYPIEIDQARALGLPVSDAMPKEIYDLMDLFPQPAQRRPSVEYIPTPYHPASPAGPRRTGP